MNMLAGANPGFEKEGAQRVRGQYLWHIYVNLGDFFKEFATKGVGVRPPPPLWLVHEMIIYVQLLLYNMYKP